VTCLRMRYWSHAPAASQVTVVLLRGLGRVVLLVRRSASLGTKAPSPRQLHMQQEPCVLAQHVGLAHLYANLLECAGRSEVFVFSVHTLFHGNLVLQQRAWCSIALKCAA
jgi:hypothetical protein